MAGAGVGGNLVAERPSCARDPGTRGRRRGHGTLHRDPQPASSRGGVFHVSTRKIVERKTKETTIRVEASVGTGVSRIDTTVSFLDHMMTALARYAGLDLTIRARGDLRHHIVEDVALTPGPAVAA